jgi:hypothetical protein
MITNPTPSGATTFGYLSAIESADHGYFGGYLLISPLGRPMEFHCTAPVRPSRAQEILYGPTLRPYLLGEQIAGALIAKTQTLPQIILTDQPSVLCHRMKIALPLVCLVSEPSDASDIADGDASGQIIVAQHRFELAAGFESDRAGAIALLAELSQTVDLPEPFDRIHGAIREAQRIDQRGPEIHGQAA